MGEDLQAAFRRGALMAGLHFVLVRSRSSGNVGAVARAMKNFAFEDLTLVDPRLGRGRDLPDSEPLFDEEARRFAWNAADVLDRAARKPTLEEALSGAGLVLATAPRTRPRMTCLSPEEGAEALASAAEGNPALVFGSESSGLTLEELSLCAGVIVIPTDQGYRDLNVAQSAVLLAYLVHRAGKRPVPPSRPKPAPHREISALFEAARDVAVRTDFLTSGGEPVARELRALLNRTGLSRREAGLLMSLLRRIRARL